MPLAPAIAASLSAGLPARKVGIWIGGLDVSAQPGATGNGYGVPYASITVDSAGPGSVSAMSFDIEDPLATLSFSIGDVVRMAYHVSGQPVFLGFLTSAESEYHDVGRTLHVTATGVEALLDWLYVPAVTVASGTLVTSAVQGALASAYGIGFPISANAITVGSRAPGSSLPLDGAVTTAALSWTGGTLRQFVTALGGVASNSIVSTIDQWGGLRVSSIAGTWGTWHLSDMASGSVGSLAGIAVADLVIEQSNDGPRSVLVQGTGASAFVSDGTGVPGPTAVISEPSATTAALCAAAGQSYLALNGGTVVSGSFGVEGYSGGFNAEGMMNGYAWADAYLQDVRLTSFLRVTNIRREFYAEAFQVVERQTYTFGAVDRRASAYLRRITRDQLI